jgi:competence protein ComEA
LVLEKLKSFDFDQFFFRNRFFILTILVGLILIGCGVLYSKNGPSVNSDKVEVLGGTTVAQDANPTLVVEISGEVENPGVYQLPFGGRIDDLLIAAGGLSAGADRDWVAKNINRAAKVTDGQKVFIPGVSDNQNLSAKTTSIVGGGGQGGLVNVNTADIKSLDSLPGIGPVYAQKIIEHRPYSDALELVSDGVVSQSIFDKIKDKITTF